MKKKAMHQVLLIVMSFLREKEDGGQLLPLTAVYEKVAEGLKVSMKTVFNSKKRPVCIRVFIFTIMNA
jgi:hypothetical protein